MSVWRPEGGNEGWNLDPDWFNKGKNTSDPVTPSEPTEPAPSIFDDWEPDWTYEPMSEEEAADRARQFRDIYYNPQAEAIERQLEQAITDALSHEGRIRSNYVAQENTLREREKQQGRMDLESAIARGAGRSGVVDHLAQGRDQYYTGQLAGMSAQQMAELNAIANQLALTQRQAPDMLRQLAEQASRIEAQELQRLMDQDYERGRSYTQDDFNRMLQVFDRTQLTPLEQLQLYINLAGVKGNFPGTMPNIFGKFNDDTPDIFKQYGIG